MGRLKLKVGLDYETYYGKRVSIVDRVPPGTEQFRLGFRFIDQHGNHYRKYGNFHHKWNDHRDLIKVVSINSIPVSMSPLARFFRWFVRVWS